MYTYSSLTIIMEMYQYSLFIKKNYLSKMYVIKKKK